MRISLGANGLTSRYVPLELAVGAEGKDIVAVDLANAILGGTRIE